MSGYATLLTFHIVTGAVGLLLGPVLMWADAHRWRRAGDLGFLYLGMVVAVGVSAIIMVVVRRDELWWLIPVSVLTVGLASLGRYAVGRAGGWSHAYVHGLGGSYIALVTATVVVSYAIDGPLYGGAQLIAWLGPTAVGTPLLEVWRRGVWVEGGRRFVAGRAS
ncbi:hypothetical protein HLB23_22980 [Nocardia uniformis]|uniref:DUF2306 domain-containing protein n=1 Tax=Nocardia uniformis TaxID=53432 RepID=A0A849CGR2_9NOCA|nr:hypothetical protein [Nocardia uniformis]NNH72691.1 hypothetical protein [Nocardia uniformis]